MTCMSSCALSLGLAKSHLYTTKTQPKQMSCNIDQSQTLYLWTQTKNMCMGVPFTQIPPSMILKTDVSLIDWEAHLQHHTIQGGGPLLR